MAVNAFLNSLAALCFPPRCLCCDQGLDGPTDFLFCPDCLATIDLIREPLCPSCGRAFPDAAGDNHLCGNCLRRPPHFTAARAVAHYREPLAGIIHAFKFSGRTFALASLARLRLCLDSQPATSSADLILPVPLHPRRLRERGFNQALLLAQAFFPAERHLIDPQLLIRSKWTPPQTALSGQTRRRNLKGAFTVTDPARLAGRAVLLVDDVFTTGSTANECARTLRRNGATEVRVLTLARVAE